MKFIVTNVTKILQSEIPVINITKELRMRKISECYKKVKKGDKIKEYDFYHHHKYGSLVAIHCPSFYLGCGGACIDLDKKVNLVGRETGNSFVHRRVKP